MRWRPCGRARQTRCAGVGLLTLLLAPHIGLAADEHPLLGIMESELKLSMEKLISPDGTKPYFLQYWVTDEDQVTIAATLGALTQSSVSHSRTLDIDIRCGDYALDSTRQIRGGGAGDYSYGWWNRISLPLNDNPLSTRHAIWLATDTRFKAAVNRLAQVKANLKVKVEEEDKSDDFSHEAPSVFSGPWLRQTYDRDRLAERVKKCSQRFRTEPLIYGSSVTLSGGVTNRLAVNSEGSKLQFGRGAWRIGIIASTIADDGMELWQYKSFDAATLDGLPDDDAIVQGVEKVIQELLALRSARVVEPYTGPAILQNRASAVFFHEIFGHRIEGHRQKDVEEGQTFAKKIGCAILPSFISVVDDPTRQKFGALDLNGFYEFDDECVPAQPTRVVENGVLKTFLLSRNPTRGFTKSNGHGRRQPGAPVCARMGNLIVESAQQVPYDQLRTRLVEECKKQHKEFGLLFGDISGGFTFTERFLPQAFKVIPILVYKVYADGRPDELVRGVDIVGTPLTCFSHILCTGDDPDVFNGYCGAESGSVPVSGISPSILVEQIEVEKKEKAQDRPPILPAPIAAEPGQGGRPEKGDKSNFRPERRQRAGQSRRNGNWTYPLFPVQQELRKDTVWRALADELDRSMPGLKLQGLERPYFIEYRLTDAVRAGVSAELGAVTSRQENRSRSLRSDVRVGSYELDNTNFQGGDGAGYGYEFNGLFGADLPIEDDYNAIRQAIWWATDRAYKEVVETLVQKKAFMEGKVIQDKPDDFSRESPTVYGEDRAPLTLELARLEELAVALSAVFRDFPAVQSSGVSVRGSVDNRYLVNTEGTRVRTAGRRFSVSVNAAAQADDGMKLSDSLSVYACQLAELPPRDELIRRCRALAERLVALTTAPPLESYTGPVLFDAEAAATLFLRQLGSSFAGGQRPVGSRASPDDFANKLNKRILPRFLNVVDDPAQEVVGGVPVMGHYRVDDQGVPAQAVRLVEAGRLKALLMSRNPSRDFSQSNGHGRGAYSGARAMVGCLLVTAEQADDAAALKRKLLSACADEDLEFGLRVAALRGTAYIGDRYGGYGALDMSDFTRRSTRTATTPLAMYKVYPDGREELARGAEIARFDLQAFKRILAAGDTPYVLNTGGGGTEGQTVIVPALLFEELDLAKIDRDFDKPPILPTPLARP